MMRRTKLRPGKPPEAQRNEQGKPRERFEHLRDEAYREWIREQPCLLASERCFYATKRSEAAHVASKATGSGDSGNLVPLCTRHHREQHDYGVKSFQRVNAVNLRQAAGALWLKYECEKGAPTL